VCTYGDLNALIGQDESGVGAGQFGRHGGYFSKELGLKRTEVGWK